MRNVYEYYETYELTEADKVFCSDFEVGVEDDNYEYIFSKIVVEFFEAIDFVRFIQLDRDLNAFTLLNVCFLLLICFLCTVSVSCSALFFSVILMLYKI